ncbi:MAG: glycosyltransferase, partial [Treponema sp.]|nr:glycosyltransferase [Treponema sp.]
MNIAMFSDCYFPRINGVCVSIFSFAQELTKLNHNVLIICPDYESKHNIKSQFQFSFEEIQETKYGKIKIFRLASHRLVFSQEDRLVKIAVWHDLKKYLDNFKPDIVHVNTEYMVGRFGSHYAKHRVIPMVYTFHTYWEDYIENYAEFAPKAVSRAFGREISLYFLKRADKIIAPTKRFEKVVQSYGINCDITVIPT